MFIIELYSTTVVFVHLIKAMPTSMLIKSVLFNGGKLGILLDSHPHPIASICNPMYLTNMLFFRINIALGIIFSS
jgi:hypothetical protein